MLLPHSSGNTFRLEGAAAYAEKHKVFQLFEGLLQELIIHRPDDPVSHLIKALSLAPAPRVLIAGPPGCAARVMCEEVSTQLGVVHVIAADLWRELAKANSSAGLEAKALVDAGSEVPEALLLTLLKEKLSSHLCQKQGWILEGFPNTAVQARAMLADGFCPPRPRRGGGNAPADGPAG